MVDGLIAGYLVRLLEKAVPGLRERHNSQRLFLRDFNGLVGDETMPCEVANIFRSDRVVFPSDGIYWRSGTTTKSCAAASQNGMNLWAHSPRSDHQRLVAGSHLYSIVGFRHRSQR